MLSYLLFFIFLFGLAALFNIPQKLQNYYRICKAVSKLPGLPSNWLWGNLHQVEMTQEFNMKMYEWREKTKHNIARFWFGPIDLGLAIYHPKYVTKEMLKTPKAENVYATMEPWLGQGLLIANSERWFRNRRLLTPAFHFDILKPYVHVYNECTDVLLSKWQAKADKGQSVNLCETISQVTLDIVLQCACSYKSGCQKQNKVDPYVDAVNKLCDLSVQRFLSLLHQANDFFYFYCTSQGWKYRKALKLAHQQSEKVIRERQKALNIEVAERRNSNVIRSVKTTRKDKCMDFLDVLITCQDEEGIGLTNLEIRNEVDTFVFEGHDTTANGITWTLYLLARHPEHQEKCREEIRDVLRGKVHFDYDDLSQLKYTHWCIKEAMRLYPPVSNVFRRLTEDIDVEDYILPKGIWVNIDMWAIHTNPDVWEKPMEYNPLRFHPDNVANRHPFAYIPFSAGSRNCIGQNFAANEELVVVGSILNRFSLELTEKEPPVFCPVAILRPSKEIKLKITPLKTD